MTRDRERNAAAPVEAVWAAAEAGVAPPREAVTALCEEAASEDAERARRGTRALFADVIERLNDSFRPETCAVYDRLFAQVIEFFRRRPGAEAFDEALRAFGLRDETAILARKAALAAPPRGPLDASRRRAIRKVLLPSRVTIGADVALTSVLIARLREALPEAEFVLLGSAKLRELFGGDRRIRVRELRYERGGRVLGRLTSWLEVLAAVRDEGRALGPDEWLAIDPDSRLTQLGLLPIREGDRGYHFFESRSYRAPGAARIGELAARWLGERLGLAEDAAALPFLALAPEHAAFGARIGGALRRGGARRLTTISFGVGGNEEKRVSAEFERALIESRLAHSTLLLDKGASPEERALVDSLLESLRARGTRIVELTPASASDWMGRERIDADLLTWDGGIGAFAGLIAAADQYIGYDSAGQHLAAALRVPTLTLFVNANSPTFAERWRPFGPGPVSVLEIPPDRRHALSIDALAPLLAALP